MSADVMNIQEMADVLGCSTKYIRTQIKGKTKTIPAPLKRANPNSSYLWRKADVEKFLKRDAANDDVYNSMDSLLKKMIQEEVQKEVQKQIAIFSQQTNFNV